MPLKTVKQTPVRMGVVGCGVVSDYGHIPAIHRAHEAKLAGFVDPDKARREAQAAKYGAPCFATFEELLKNVELDAVAMPTHPAVRRELIQMAAGRGLHVFSEKPLTENLEDAQTIVRAMDAAGLFLGIAFVYRGKAIVQRMMSLLREGAIGELCVARFVHLWDYHGLRNQKTNGDRRRRALKNLGCMDCGVHHWDLARYMTGGEFASVHAVGRIVERENIYPDHIIANARMSNGVAACIEDSAVWGYTAAETPKYELSYDLIGRNGVLSARDSDLYIVSGEKQWNERLSDEKAWDLTYHQFFRTILGKPETDTFIASGRDALANMRVVTDVVRQCMAAGKG